MKLRSTQPNVHRVPLAVATPTRAGEPAGEDVSLGPLTRMFSLCNPEQMRAYLPEKRSFRIHGHSTTIRLERAFWSVLEELAAEEGETVAAVITRIADHCLDANDKNLASCLRVVCLKYINVFVVQRPEARLRPLGLSPEENRMEPKPGVLDAKGLNCPLPILKAKKTLKDVPQNGVLQVLATDPGAVKDFEAFCRSTGNTLLDWSEQAGVFSFRIRKTG